MEIDRSSRTVFFQLDWEVWREKASVERGGEGREKGRTVIESNVQGPVEGFSAARTGLPPPLSV